MPELGLDIAPQIFRKTNSHEGWREFFSPDTGAMRYLSYARLIFGPATRSHTLDTSAREWVLFCIKPSVTVTIGGQEFTLGRHDMLYLPRQTQVHITGDASADIAAAGATSDADSAPQLVHFSTIKDDPAFFFEVGDEKM